MSIEFVFFRFFCCPLSVLPLVFLLFFLFRVFFVLSGVLTVEGHRDRSSWLCRVHRAILRNIICHFRGETEVPQCQCQENGLGMRKAGLLLNPQTITSHRTGVVSTANNSKAAQELRNKLLTVLSVDGRMSCKRRRSQSLSSTTRQGSIKGWSLP